MKKITLLFILLGTFAQAQRFDWVTTAGYSGVANSVQGAIAIARDSQGNLYTLNSANGQQICQGVTANPTGNDTFLYKFNAAGVLQYIKTIGFSFDPMNIQIGENDNLYVLGSLRGTNSLIIGTETFVEVQDRNYIIKFDPTGTLLWKTFNNGPLSQSPMLQFANNHIYFQSGNLSISKLNTDGQVVATLTANSFVPATAVQGVLFKGSGVLANGDLVFSAVSRGTITYGTTILIPTGNQFLEIAALTIRTSENLGFVWATYTNGLRDPDQNNIPMAVGNDNGIYIGVQVVSSLTASTDTLINTGDGASGIGIGAILKMDAEGNKIWLKSTTGSAHPWSMLNNPDGSGILCAGQIFGFSALSFGSTTVNPINGNSFITKIDYNGNFQNSFAFGSGPGTFAKPLATNNEGVFYVGGRMANVTPPTFSCVSREGRAGLYLGKFTEQPDRAPTPSIVLSGNLLTASPPFTGTIQWFLNGSPISGANGQTHLATQTGNYTVTYVLTDYVACVSTSPITTISALSITDQNDFNGVVKVFPNPSNGFFTIQANKIIETANIIVSDLNGRIVHQEKAIGFENIILYLSSLQKGIYLLKMTTEKGDFVQKIIAQ